MAAPEEPMPDEPPDDAPAPIDANAEPEQVPDVEKYMVYLEGFHDAEEEARQEVVCRTLQDLRGETEEGRAWLADPANSTAVIASNLAHHYFNLACRLGNDDADAEDKADAEAEVLRAVRYFRGDSPEQRRNDFLLSLIHI